MPASEANRKFYFMMDTRVPLAFLYFCQSKPQRSTSTEKMNSIIFSRPSQLSSIQNGTNNKVEFLFAQSQDWWRPHEHFSGFHVKYNRNHPTGATIKWFIQMKDVLLSRLAGNCIPGRQQAAAECDILWVHKFSFYCVHVCRRCAYVRAMRPPPHLFCIVCY